MNEEDQDLMVPDGSGNRHGADGSQTQSRSGDYPYDKPVTYGRKNAWEQVSEDLGREPGGMGMDGMDPFEMELDDLKGQFRTAFQDAIGQTQSMDSPSLFSLLTDLDPDFAAHAFAPDADEEMQQVYFDWADTVCGNEEI